MTRETAKKNLEVIIAYANGETIQYLTSDDKAGIFFIALPDGSTHTYEYDNKGNLISDTYPDGSKVTFKYDDSGKIISFIHLNNQKTTY